jgi:hypothetical protein
MAATDATQFDGHAHIRAAFGSIPPSVSVAPERNNRTPEIQMNFLTTAAGALIGVGAPTAIIANLLGCAPATQRAGVPPAPIAFRWPDPAFLPERQCHRAVPAERLASYLPRASLTMTIPGTRSVTLDRERGCLTIVVESVGTGRLAELIIRGVSVPRHAVLLLLASPEQG